ncbi:MAG TPA: G1 family glutamic endopeptidase [Tepidiformaceae bacterium]|nr:G1 family glutamic endopeptidase [Tepidiformaceae bacterium]
MQVVTNRSFLSWRRLLLLGVVLLLAFAAVQSASGAAATSHGPRRPLQHGTSTNWSGYASLTSLTNPQSNAVTAAGGSWTVPTVDCSVTPTGYSATWVGIDGYSSGTVEQLGTEQDCQSGVPSYSAWWEMYPGPSFGIGHTVQAGDSMTASVTYTGTSMFRYSTFVLQLTDTTQGWTFSTTRQIRGVARSSAEWVQEAPSSSQGVLPLSDFGTVSFTNSWATINGVTGPINTWPNDPITMIDGSATATPSGLTPSGTGSAFSVTFGAGSPPPPPPPPPTTVNVHVGSVTYGSTSNSLTTTVSILNSSGGAVPGASVSVKLTNTTRGLSWTATGTTGSNGAVSFQLTNPPSGTYTTTVTAVTGSNLSWNGSTPSNSYTITSTRHVHFSTQSNAPMLFGAEAA